jgi:pSer/pThr/pTyr-binding forkhead associated (FHA) protein
MQEDWNITLSVLDCPEKSFIGQQKVFFASPVSIGRADNNDFIILDPAVSRNHAILRITNDYSRVFVTDLSTHGTFVSGKEVPKGRGTGFTIENSDTIKIGDTLLRYELKLKPNVQSTMVGRIDRSIIDTPVDPLPSLSDPEPSIPDIDMDSADSERKGFSPLALTIIAVCLVLIVYLLFFVK